MKANWSWLFGVAAMTGALAFGQEDEELGLEFLEGARLKATIERDFAGADKDLAKAEGLLLAAIESTDPAGANLKGLKLQLAQTRLLLARVRLELGKVESAQEYLEKVLSAELDGQGRLELDRLEQRLASAAMDGRQAEAIRQLAMTKLREGDLETVQQFGSLAVPALVEWIEGRLNEFPDTVQQDPLRTLGVLSRETAAELVGRHMESGTFLFKKRVLRVMNALMVLVNEHDYEASAEIPRPTKSPEWLRFIEIAAEEPALPSEVMPFLPHIFRHSACTPRLQATLIAALEPSDPRYRDLVRAVATQSSFGEDARGLLEKALVSRDPELVPLAITRWKWQREVLHPLAESPDARVRETVVRNLGTELDAEAREILTHLAGDQDNKVIDEVMGRLRRVDWEEHAPEYLPILDAVARNPSTLSDSDLRETLDVLVERASQHDAGAEWLVRLALETNDDRLVLAAPQRSRNVLFRISPDLIGPFAKRVYEVSRKHMVQLMSGVVHPKNWDLPRQPELVSKFHELAREPDLDSGLTLFFALCYPWTTPPDLRPAIRRALADPRWTEQAMVAEEEWLPDVLKHRFQYSSGETVNDLLLPLLTDSSLSDDLLRLLVKHHDVRAPKGEEVVRAILERWLAQDRVPNAEPYETVERALSQLGRFPFEGSKVLLRRLAQEGRYLNAVAKAMGDSRDPSFVDDLAAILRDPRTRSVDFDAAFLALRGFLTDETAEVLLDLAAETGAGETRDACLSTVDDIRAYQDARQRWESRKLSQATLERATAELYELLDSDLEAQRVEAVRGLGTLGAIEAIPRLIRMLSEPSATLREAAQAALDRLNAIHKEEEG